MNRQSGFTLVELMIVLVIASILVGIAVPAYTDSVAKGRRAEAKSEVLQAAQTLQRCFTRFNAFNDANCGVVATLNGAGITSENGHYTITATTLTATTYTLQAAPQGGQASDDAGCGNLTLTSTGTKGVSGTHSVNDCW